jgi:hypothetical protein
MLTVDIHQEKIPAVFSRFCQLVGEKAWLDQLVRIDAEVKRNPFLREYLLSQNSLVLALAHCSHAAASNGNQLPWDLTSRPELFEAYMFADQTLALIDTARKFSNKRANSLTCRVRDALKTPTAVQAMQLEARVATHFVRIGHSVRFPELGSGSETFDLLIENLGNDGLEIECKSVTHDKGRKIHRREALEFFHLILPTVQMVARGVTAGLAVVVTVPTRMPELETLHTLIQSVTNQILLGKTGMLNDGTQVRLVDFQPSELGELTTPPSKENKDAVDRISGTSNRECFIYQAEEKSGLVALILQSTQPDSMLHEVFATLADSAGRQLTGRRAGAFLGSFQDLGRNALHEIAVAEGRGGNYSALAHQVSKFLKRTDIPHVVGVGFLSAPDNNELPVSESQKGVTYYFPKPTSQLWHPAYSGLFGIDPRVPEIVV